jgi:hypothetical protein
MTHTPEQWNEDISSRMSLVNVGLGQLQWWIWHSDEYIDGMRDGEFVGPAFNCLHLNRIASCVNALAGMNLEGISDVVDALETAIAFTPVKYVGKCPNMNCGSYYPDYGNGLCSCGAELIKIETPRWLKFARTALRKLREAND